MVLAYALKAPEGHYVSASTTFSPCLSVLRYLVIDPRFPLLEASAVLPTERQREMVPPSLGDETSKLSERAANINFRCQISVFTL